MPPDFYGQDTLTIAKSILGCFLIHRSPDGLTVGRIVETEAYLSTNDRASHASKGQTKRNAAMFGPSGHAYVYFTYGLHWLMNVVSGPTGIGEAVLIRALEPIDGLELMKQRRHQTNLVQLCNGPAKLVQAMGITGGQNGASLSRGSLIITAEYNDLITAAIPIVTTTRIGIKQAIELPLRFYLENCPYVSQL